MCTVQAIAKLHSSLQTAVFVNTDLHLSMLIPVVPPHLLGALIQRHVSCGVLDISLRANSRDRLGRIPLGSLTTTIASLPSLCGLKICPGALTCDDLPHLAAIITCHSATLQSIWFQPGEQDPGYPTAGSAIDDCRPDGSPFVQCLIDILPQLIGLQHLDLCRTCAHDSSDLHRDMLMDSLLSLTNLTSLSLARQNKQLSFWRAKSPHCKVLASNVHRLRSLCCLDVSGNSLPLPDLCMLFMVVANMPSMREFRAQQMNCDPGTAYARRRDEGADVDEAMSDFRSHLLRSVADLMPASMVAPSFLGAVSDAPRTIQSHIRVLGLSLIHI